MVSDSITDEIRLIRHQLAARCDNDVSKILADARRRQNTYGRTYVTLPKRPPRHEAKERDTQSQSPMFEST